jgi:hypothetical protein
MFDVSMKCVFQVCVDLDLTRTSEQCINTVTEIKEFCMIRDQELHIDLTSINVLISELCTS